MQYYSPFTVIITVFLHRLVSKKENGEGLITQWAKYLEIEWVKTR